MEKLTFKEKFCYGLGDLSSNIIFSAISFYLLYFFVCVGGLNPFLAGVIFIVAKFWDAITDYLMGRIVDKTKSRFGSKRVYMIFGAVPYGIAFVLLWLVPFNESTAQGIRFIYYLISYMFFCTIWTVVYIPYNALTASLTDDYDERTELNGFRIILANVGMLLGAALFALLAQGPESILFSVAKSEKNAFLISSAIFGIIAAIIMLISAFSVKERIVNKNQNNTNFFKTIKEFFKLKEFRFTMLYYLLSMVGFDIIMSIFIFFVNDALGFADGGALSMAFIAIPLVVAIATAVLWVKLSEKYNKHVVYKYAVFGISIVLLGCLFVPKENIFFLTLICFGAGFFMSAIQILPFASVPDVIEVDEYVNGVRREGAYYGIVQFMYKTASGISIAFVSFVLGAFGYVEAIDGKIIEQPQMALFSIRLILGLVPGIIFLISIIFGYKANLGRERFEEIKLKLKNK